MVSPRNPKGTSRKACLENPDGPNLTDAVGPVALHIPFRKEEEFAHADPMIGADVLLRAHGSKRKAFTLQSILDSWFIDKGTCPGR